MTHLRHKVGAQGVTMYVVVSGLRGPPVSRMLAVASRGLGLRFADAAY